MPDADGLARCDPLDAVEMAVDYAFGSTGEPEPLDVRGRGVDRPGHARRALSTMIEAWLSSRPVGILFSGGRDSSALLALATAVARREGLPEPMAITCRYPEQPDPEEAAAQAAAVDAIRPAQWLQLEIRDEQDLLGPAARASLRRHGYLYPSPIHGWEQIYTKFSGHLLIDGEGGDEIFGPLRATPVAHLLGRRGVRQPGRRTGVAVALAPRVVRRAAAARGARAHVPDWLRPAARREYVRRVAAERAAEPLDWRAAVRRQPYLRRNVLNAASTRLLSAPHDVDVVSPFLDRAFLDALALDAGRWGYASRTTAMRELFGDLLPDSIVRRRTKAAFNTAFCGRHSRAFAQRWDGVSGVDLSLVEPEALRAAWLSATPHRSSFALLQQAWLASGDPE